MVRYSWQGYAHLQHARVFARRSELRPLVIRHIANNVAMASLAPLSLSLLTVPVELLCDPRFLLFVELSSHGSPEDEVLESFCDVESKVLDEGYVLGGGSWLLVDSDPLASEPPWRWAGGLGESALRKSSLSSDCDRLTV